MDKYARKQIARWEQTKAKTEDKFEERKKENASRREWDKVAITIQGYTPSAVSVLAKALELLKEEPLIRSIHEHEMLFLLGHDFAAPFYRLYRGRWIAPPPPDMEEEVRRGCERKTIESAIQLIPTLTRHMDRVDMIREELLFKTHRNRVIQNCLAIKEELMMAAWHPRRVGRILETYGWEALDNLLGVE